MPTKDRIEWPYVVLLVGIVVMVAATLHLLSAWVAYVIFGALWVVLRYGPRFTDDFPWAQGGATERPLEMRKARSTIGPLPL